MKKNLINISLTSPFRIMKRVWTWSYVLLESIQTSMLIAIPFFWNRHTKMSFENKNQTSPIGHKVMSIQSYDFDLTFLAKKISKFSLNCSILILIPSFSLELIKYQVIKSQVTWILSLIRLFDLVGSFPAFGLASPASVIGSQET